MTSLECSICLAFYHRDFSQGKRTGLIGCPQCKCPLCRQQIDTREGGLEPLPNHITASDHITARYEVGVEDLRNHCGCCWKDGAADFHCNDCEDFLCLSCKDQHLRTKQTRNHVITVVDDFDRTWEKTTDQFVNCRFHDPFLLEYFCVRCGTVCCAMGRHNKHESHNVQLLPEAAEEKRNMVKSYIEMAKEHYTTVANEIYDILINQDNLKTFIDRETVTIDNVADQFKGSIDRARRELKTRIIRTLETLDEKFKESLESYNDKFKMILALIQSTDQILNEASNQDVLSFQGDLINHLIKEEAKFKVKDPHSTYLATSEVEDALIKNIHVQDPTNVSSLLQPLLLNKVRRPFKVEGREITAIACLNNGVILVCQGNTKRLTVVGARGEDFWCFVIRFRIGSLIQTADGTIVATELNGTRAATFRLWTDAIAMKSLNGFVHGVSATRDGACLIFCCSDTKTANKKHAVNGHISITNLSLEVQMQLNINTSGDVIKYAVQKSNGDFIAATTKRCFILSSLGCVKSSFNFVGTMHGTCLDRRDNCIIVRDNECSKIVTLLDSKLEERKDLITLTETPNVNAKYCMTIDEQGDVWLSYSNTIQCIRYNL